MPFASPKPTCDEIAGAPLAAGIVFVAADGDVLLLRRANTEPNYGGHWGLPGGKAEEGESAQDAASREFKEECGLDIDMGSTLKLLDRVATPNGMVFSTFAKAAEDKFVPTLDGEHSGYCWASLDRLPGPLHPSVAKVLGQHIGAAADMTPEDWAGLREGFAKWTREEEHELSHTDSVDTEDAGWNESDHPRASNGEFGSGGGSAASSEHISKPGSAPSKGTGWVKVKTANLASLGLKPKKRGSGSNSTEAAQVAWSYAKETGKHQRAVLTGRGWAISRAGEKLAMGQPYIDVSPDGEADMYKYSLDDLETQTRAQDMRLAMDRQVFESSGRPGNDLLALDGASVRKYDADGHLHISRTPISKANICPYWGHEIPDYEALGLDPDRKYQLFRHPDELKKAAASSNGKQLMLGHVPVSARAPQKDKQVGSLGTDGDYVHPYLYNSLHLTDQEGIDAIEAADEGKPDGAKELSCGYRYTPDMTPGTYMGAHYDGVMRDLIFNHVALVPEGRAGADVVVGDSQISEKEILMSKNVLSRFGGASALALSLHMLPKLAADAKLDISPLFEGVTKKNFPERKAKIAADLALAAKGKLAKDANLDDITGLLDKLEKADVAEGADEDPSSGLPMNSAELAKKAKDEAAEEDKKKAADRAARDEAGREFLKGKMSAEDLKAYDDVMGCEDAEAEENASGKEAAGAAKPVKDAKGMDKQAVDAAIKENGEKIRREMRETAQAYQDVEPWSGKMALGMDSAADVYRTALKGLGMDAKVVDGMHADALKPVLLAQPKPGEQNRSSIALDASLRDSSNFQSRWGGTVERLGHA